MKAEQLKHVLTATRMKQKVKEKEFKEEKEMLKRNNVILARQKDELEVRVRHVYMCVLIMHVCIYVSVSV